MSEIDLLGISLLLVCHRLFDGLSSSHISTLGMV